MSKTDENLQNALTGEARARLKYTAFALQASHPEIAQLFLEAAGAETIHGMSHLRLAGGIGTTRANDEIEEMYRCFIRKAADHRQNAVARFRLAVERKKHHREMFQEAFTAFKA